MQLDLGQKIRELRRRDGRTQEALADAIGVTSQAVSRWEANGGYPDMEMIPAIANYFGVTIDTILLNDSRSKEKDLKEFEEKYYTLSWKIPEQIEFTREYCRKYPDNNHCSYLLMLAIRNHLLENKNNTEKYKNAIQILES